MTIATFLLNHYDFAKKAGKRYGINHWFMLAQAYAETGGNSYGLNTRKNPGSITAFGPANNYWKGERSQSSASGLWFRVYPNLQAGWYDFARLLAEKYKMGQYNNIATYADAISRSKYITEAVGDDRAQYRANIIRSYERLVALNATVQKAPPIFLVITAVVLVWLLTYKYAIQPRRAKMIEA